MAVLRPVFLFPVVAPLPEDEEMPDKVVQLLEVFKPPAAEEMPGVAMLPGSVSLSEASKLPDGV